MSIDTGLSLSYNANFPIPNIDQSSQQFRDNFATIKTAIENLQIAQSTSGSVLSIATSQGSAGNIIINASYPNNTLTLPTGYQTSGSPAVGMITYDPNTQTVQWYSGAAWLPFVFKDSSGNVSLTNLSVSTKMTLTYTPSASTDGVNVGYVTNAISAAGNTTTQAISAINSNVATISTGLSNEITARSSGDTNLQNQINAINTELSNASSNAGSTSTQISSLQQGLSDESNARVSGDNNLQTLVNQLGNSVNNATALSSAVSADLATEVSNRGTSEAAIYTYVNTVVSSVSTVSNAVAAEANARITGDGNLQTQINQLNNNLANAIAQEQADIANVNTDYSAFLSTSGGTMFGDLNYQANANITNAALFMYNLPPSANSAPTFSAWASNGSIVMSGSLTAGGDVSGLSDASLKYNLRDIDSPLDTVLKLKGLVYNRKDLEGNPEQMGLIAQDVQPHVPQVVHDHDGLLGIAYGNLVPLLIEAVKELSDKVTDLKAQLANK